MNHQFNENSALTRLIKISQYIINDSSLVAELMQEVKTSSKGPICSMFKSLFKKNLLIPDLIPQELQIYFFHLKSINEFKIFSSPDLGLSCFFMPKGSSFPLHDHANKVVFTGVVFGEVRYLTLNKLSQNHFVLSSKGTARRSDVMFGTEEFRNIHSLYAAQDSIILDIFMPNQEEVEPYVYEVITKRQREFFLKKRLTCSYKRLAV
jgi:putative component of membrane protein insertase Oxa1/YidC/SpoIIIJ protein YidD